MRHFGTLALVLFVSISARSAVAETITDRAVFNEDAGSLVTLDFENIAPEGGYKFFGNLSLAGVDFTGQHAAPGGPAVNDVWVFDDGFGGGYYTTGSGAALIGGLDTYGYDGFLIATFGAGVRAVGTDFTSSVATRYTVTLSDGQIIKGVSQGAGQTTFVGVIADQDIASIRFQNNNGGYSTIDNFSFGAGPALGSLQVQPVPLPAAAWGGLALLAGLGATQRFRRRRDGATDVG